MQAKDVMTTDIVTVEPETSVSDIAALMHEKRISGVPVVKDGALVGVVSEGDLIRRQEIGSEADRRAWWLSIFADSGSIRRYIKSHGKRAADVMTGKPITVEEDTPLAEIARLFEEKHIKRVPVMRKKKLVGIVSRANLVQAIASAATGATTQVASSDQVIRAALLAELNDQSWWTGSNGNVTVSNGVVHLWGLCDSDAEWKAVRVAAEGVAGVKAVEDHRIRIPMAMGEI